MTPGGPECMSPPKKRATEEEEKSTPQWEAALPRGVKKEDILPKRYETFTADTSWVQCVRCSLLGLEPHPLKRTSMPWSTLHPELWHRSRIYLREEGRKAGRKAFLSSVPQTSSLLWWTGSHCTLKKACRNISWWLYPPL